MNYLDSFDAFCLFLALKNHFTQDSYDFFKYHGKTNATKEAFEKRKDRLQFQKLARRESSENLQTYLVANLVAGKTWVGQFLEVDAETNYHQFKVKLENITETVIEELKKSLEHCEPTKLFKVDKHEYPQILLDHLDTTQSMVSLVVLNNFVQFVPIYNETYAGDEVWETTARMITKLTPFITYDRREMRKRLKEVLL